MNRPIRLLSIGCILLFLALLLNVNYVQFVNADNLNNHSGNTRVQEAERRDMPISAIAEEFGFAGASSFSHAYRRAFGRAPVWSKAS